MIGRDESECGEFRQTRPKALQMSDVTMLVSFRSCSAANKALRVGGPVDPRLSGVVAIHIDGRSLTLRLRETNGVGRR